MISILYFPLLAAFCGVTLTKVLTDIDKPLHWWLQHLRSLFLEEPKPTTVSHQKLDRVAPSPRTKKAEAIPFGYFLETPPPSPYKWIFDLLGGCTVCFTMQLAWFGFPFWYTDLPLFEASFLLVSWVLMLNAVYVFKHKVALSIMVLPFCMILYHSGVSGVFIHIATVLITGYLVTVLEYGYTRYFTNR